jgi:hypothetical protein
MSSSFITNCDFHFLRVRPIERDEQGELSWWRVSGEVKSVTLAREFAGLRLGDDRGLPLEVKPLGKPNLRCSLIYSARKQTAINNQRLTRDEAGRI